MYAFIERENKNPRLFSPELFPKLVLDYFFVLLLDNEQLEHSNRSAFVLDDHMWGVQFHPEFRELIIHKYIEEQREQLLRDRFKIAELHITVN